MSFASDLAHAVHGGDRRSLSKAITLVESSRAEDRAAAHELLSLLTPVAAAGFRVGVTGVPGAGKSTLIDVLGSRAIVDGRRVAVLAVDPSSRESGGSVLGDKTRMARLSMEASAFIRPSPTLGILGGTAGRTHEVILLCEAAGYDLIFVETVGVGQSEAQVATMVDCVLLVLLAGAGDDLSSMKRGVLEAADVIAFNKADGERRAATLADAASLRSSLGIIRSSDAPEVLALSAIEGAGIDLLWATLVAKYEAAEQRGSLRQRRARQRKAWFEAALEEALQGIFAKTPDLAQALAAAELDVQTGALSPFESAQRLVALLLERRRALIASR